MIKQKTFIRIGEYIIDRDRIRGVDVARVNDGFGQHRCVIFLYYREFYMQSLEEDVSPHYFNIATCEENDLSIYLDLIMDTLTVGCGTDLVSFIKGPIFQNQVKYIKHKKEEEDRKWAFYAKSQLSKIGPFDLDAHNARMDLEMKFAEHEKKNREEKE